MGFFNVNMDDVIQESKGYVLVIIRGNMDIIIVIGSKVRVIIRYF